MALPVLNETPKYTLTIPSTGKKVKFRPYLIKEEKVLLLASQNQDLGGIMGAVLDTIEACVTDPLDRRKLTTFDIEYMFLKIRSKSVGEIAEVGLKCQSDDCSATTKVGVNLEEIECRKGQRDKVIQLDEKISVQMKYPSYSQIEFSDDEQELGFQILASSIEAVMTDEERIDMEEEDPADVRRFLEQMNREQFDALSQFIEDMPQVKEDVNWVCETCGHNNHITLKGMSDFF